MTYIYFYRPHRIRKWYIYFYWIALKIQGKCHFTHAAIIDANFNSYDGAEILPSDLVPYPDQILDLPLNMQIEQSTRPFNPLKTALDWLGKFLGRKPSPTTNNCKTFIERHLNLPPNHTVDDLYTCCLKYRSEKFKNAI